MVPRYSGLLSLVEPELKSYLPGQEWTPSTLKDMIDHVYSADADSSLLATRDWWAFTAIIFAMLYAAACKSLSSHKQHSSLIEVAVDPGILPVGNSSNRAKFKRWISVLQVGTECPSSGAIPLSSGQRADGAPIHEWAALHYELFSGATIEPSITNSRDFKEHILGFSKHGIFVIRDIALNPSLRPESLVEFHIQQGQPIAIPVDEKGFIVGQCDTIADDISDAELGSDMDEIEETLKITVIKETPKVTVIKRDGSDRKINIDLEPCWDSDPRKVVFRVRSDGILKCSIYPRRVSLAIIKTFDDETRLGGSKRILSAVPCECKSPENEISNIETCRVIKMSQLIDEVTSELDSDVVRCDHMDHSNHVFLLAGGDIGSQVLSAVCFPTCRYYSSCPACVMAVVKDELKYDRNRKYCIMIV